MTPALSRRSVLKVGAGLALGGLSLHAPSRIAAEKPADKGQPARFQIACMTLPYAAFPLAQALSGLQSAGYKFIAWGTSHKEDGGTKPVLASDATLDTAKELAKRCRDLGMEPVMLFGPSPEAVDALKQRVKQAAAAGIAQVLTMGSTKGNDAKLWVKNFKEVGPVARDLGVRVVVKQHGGNTGTGAVCADITRTVDDDGVRVNYDAGNVMDYNKLDPIPDIKKCRDQVYSFCIKDHRRVPKDEDCGPGLGEIDHYQLLNTVAFTGRTIPLCCENIFAPLLKRPTKPEEIDALAKRAREFLELVVAGLQA